MAGVDVYAHWSLLIAAIYFIDGDNIGRGIAAFFALMGIVLLHELGHVFAARRVGGESKAVMLSLFFGLAFTKVPHRPGPQFWSVAGGPLVNLVLLPLLMGGAIAASALGATEVARFCGMAFFINKWLLIINVLPIYPMDGGRLLQATLWTKLGFARSLQISAVVGMIGLAGLLVWALSRSWFFMAVAVGFMAVECWNAYKRAQALKQLEALPRHTSVACPSCHESPPGGPLYVCGSCGNRFDPFSTHAICPHCNTMQPAIPCVHCGAVNPSDRWGVKPRGSASDGPVIEI